MKLKAKLAAWIRKCADKMDKRDSTWGYPMLQPDCYIRIYEKKIVPLRFKITQKYPSYAAVMEDIESELYLHYVAEQLAKELVNNGFVDVNREITDGGRTVTYYCKLYVSK